MKNAVVQTLTVTVSLFSFLVGCGASSQNDSSLEGSGFRYLCADEVIFRDDNLNPLESISLDKGSKVSLLPGSKNGEGDLAAHSFVKVALAQGKTAWVSSSYLKVSQCSEKNSAGNSVLHFKDEAPGILAMLDAIAYAEFRNHPEATSAKAYQTIYDYRNFSSFHGHPRMLICAGHCSDAAGRYQFMSSTWDDSNRYLSANRISEISWLKGPLTDFSPRNQDKMAIFKIWWRYGYTGLKNIKPGDNGTLLEVTRRLSAEWASLPGSTYGQGELAWETFKKYYWSRYANYR